MKKQRFFFLVWVFFLGLPLIAQETILAKPTLVSPEIHQDHSVTFRLWAPHAQIVQITGNFLPTKKVESPYGEVDVPVDATLTKDASGVWSFTSAVLEPELYGYAFVVDGVTITDPSNPYQIRDIATVTNMFMIEGGQADLYSVNDVPHGTVSHPWYASPSLGMDRRLSVYTPPGYEDSNENYPVLYLLHGAGGDEMAWLELGRAVQILDNLIAEGKARPMIVVMPNGNVSQDAAPGEGSDGYYTPQFMLPVSMNGQYEASFMDIINFVESHYRAKADKAHRAIAGLSMGGFHSMHISRYYPNTFDYVGLFSAAIMPREDATGKVYSDIDGTLKTQKDNSYKLYWIKIGKTDFLYQANIDFRNKLDAMGMPYEYEESEGGHIWKNWRVYLSEFVPKLFK
ncbi:MAG: alpha/beta hydrolase-fold protein [Flavobacteriaceae bacterium]